MFRATMRHRVGTWVVCAVWLRAPSLWAQTPKACPEEPSASEYAANLNAARAALLDDTFHHRVRPALGSTDASVGTASVAPLQVVGGVTDSGTVVKARAGVKFWKYGLADVTLSIPDSALKATKFDPLELPHVYTIRPKITWAPWTGVVPEAALAAQVCAQTKAFRAARPVGAAPSAEEFMVFRARQPETRSILVDLKKALVFSASYESGRQAFEYAVHRDASVSYSKTTETHQMHAGAATAGVVVPHHAGSDGKGERFFTALLTYQRLWGYKDAKSALLCAPLSLSTAAQCEQLAPGPPGRADTNTLQVDARYWFEWPFAPGFRVTRDFRADINTFEAPIYFLGKDSATFTGGVTIGYKDAGPARGRFIALFMGGTFAKPAEPKP